MFITGPDVIKKVTGEETSTEELGGAFTHNSVSGNAHFYYESEQECFKAVRELLFILPSNNKELPPAALTPKDNPNRNVIELNEIIPDDPKKAYDMKSIIKSVVDEGFFLEIQELYAQNSIICFARLNNKTVGIIANQPKFAAGSLDINSADKISRFINFCDAFNIPILNFVDAPGFLPGVNQEYGGIIRHGAKILYSIVQAQVPKIAVITRKAYGGAYIAMASPSLGYDYVISWPNAEIAVMGAESAVEIIYKKEISKHSQPEEFKNEKTAEYKKQFSNPIHAAKHNILDLIIEPQYTRIELINALEMLYNKRELRSIRKHGNPPQ